jgi:mono/diheme cytochrome c family protein
MKIMLWKTCWLSALVSAGLISGGTAYLAAVEPPKPAAVEDQPPLPFGASSATIDIAPSKPAPVDPLSWDAMFKEYVARTNDLESHLKFSVTNISASDVLITRLRPSCGCTVARMPANPWKLAPGERGTIEITTDLRNKRGVLNKTVTVESSAGLRVLQMKITIPSDSQRTPGMQDRGQNLLISLADRQAIFHGECASCHVVPAVGKMGAPLYEAACGICHDTVHRASIVPVLTSLPMASSTNFWLRWIVFGKTNSLMPGFAKSQGGPLSDAQVQSLVDYLSTRAAP